MTAAIHLETEHSTRHLQGLTCFILQQEPRPNFTSRVPDPPPRQVYPPRFRACLHTIAIYLIYQLTYHLSSLCPMARLRLFQRTTVEQVEEVGCFGPAWLQGLKVFPGLLQ